MSGGFVVEFILAVFHMVRIEFCLYFMIYGGTHVREVIHGRKRLDFVDYL